MPWAQGQQTIAAMAARSAGWNDQQRYTAMRAAGCRSGFKGSPNPSVKNPANTQRSYELYMDLAEGAAAARGESVIKPSNRKFSSWREAVAASTDRERWLARSLQSEGHRRIPHVFDPAWGDRAAAQQTARDTNPIDGSSAAASRIDELHAWQLYKVIEAMKARLGRELHMRGLSPEGGWSISRDAKRRAERTFEGNPAHGTPA